MDTSIDTFQLLNSRVFPVLDTWSTPDDFYTRSTVTNVADIVLNQTSTYVSTTLNLDNIRPILDNGSDGLDLLPELT